MKTDTLRARATLAVAALIVIPSSGAAASATAGRDDEVDALLERFFAADALADAGRAEREELLAELDRLVEPLDAGDVEDWRERVLEAWADGPLLPKGSGRKYFWEDDDRGLFLVGGKTRRPKGLFVGMHGGGAGSGDAQTSYSTFNSAVGKYKWLALYPEVLEKTEHGWTDSGTEEWVLELVDRALRTYDIDRDKVFLGGHSMGGYGSWMLGGHHADRIAGFCASAGAPTVILDRATHEPVDVVEGLIPNLRNVRLAVYQSDDDPRVPPDANRLAFARLEQARERWGGYDFEYWEVEGRGHETPPGGARKLLEKVADAERDARPDKVVWQPTLAWKRQFYWLFWEQPRLRATVVAELDGEENRVRVECATDAAGLWILLDERTLDPEREVTVELNGEESWRGLPEARASTLLRSGAHGDPELMYGWRVPVQR